MPLSSFILLNTECSPFHSSTTSGGEMASRRHASDGTKKHLPGYAKTIILLQGLIIAFLSLWVYEEYLNNQYFQVYVNNAFRTNGEAYVLLPTFILTILAVVAYAKIRVANGRSEAARVGSHGGDLGEREVAPD